MFKRNTKIVWHKLTGIGATDNKFQIDLPIYICLHMIKRKEEKVFDPFQSLSCTYHIVDKYIILLALTFE